MTAKTNLPNPKDLLGVKKPRLYLWPHVATIYGALAMEDGAAKYGPYNWREHPVKASIYVEAAERHLGAFLDREECARDSGKPHLAHALACLAILVDALESGNLIDDRPTRGPFSDVIERFRKDLPQQEAPRHDLAAPTDGFGPAPDGPQAESADRVTGRSG